MATSLINPNMINPNLNKAFFGSAVAIPFAANITPDLSQGNIFTVTQTGNMTIGNPTVLDNGFYFLYVIVDATGSYTLGFDNEWNLLGSGSYFNTPNSVNIIEFMTFSGQTTVQYYIDQR